MPSNKPSAKIADGRLILSLPDAETPALWMMDLGDAQTSVIRLESDRQGFFILKKHGAKGQPETVAVYRDRNRGTQAMNVASKAMEKARTRPSSGSSDGFSRAGRIFIYFVMTWSLLRLVGIDQYVIYRMYMAHHNAGLTALSNSIAQSPTPSMAGQEQAPSANTTAGVPMSADQFLQNQITTQH